jgi:2-polyprenyl-3-methyl-5-hydroxy-6-metoxy-1,4-benzoquinol methylase
VSSSCLEPSQAIPDQETWDRVWRHWPNADRDDALLAREANHPRWQWIQGALGTCFESFFGLKTIELGSGRGDWSALLAQNGAETTLFDANNAALNQAFWRFERLNLSARFVCGDFLNLSDEFIGRFDAAFSSGVIEHFHKNTRTEAIFAHKIAVRPGGLVVIGVPNALCPPYRIWKGYLEFRGWWPYGFERPFTAGELKRRAAAAGLVDVQTRCFGFRQSVGDHLWKSLLGRDVDWSQRRSVLDSWMGSMLVMTGRRPAE